MAAASSVAPVQRQHHSSRRTRASKHKPRSSSSSAVSDEDYTDVPEVEKLRRARTDYYGTPLQNRRSVSSPSMAQDGEQGRRSSFRDDSRTEVTASGYVDRSRSHAGHRHRRRKQKEEESADDGGYVYKSTDERSVRRSKPSRRISGSEERDSSTSLLPDRRRILRTLGLDGQNHSTEQKEIRRSSRPASIQRSSSGAGGMRVHIKETRRLGTDSETMTSKHRPRVAR